MMKCQRSGMPKRWTWAQAVIAMLAVGFPVWAACGISEGQYKKQVKKANALEKKMEKKEAALKTLKDEVKALKGKLAGATQKLDTAGERISKVTSEAKAKAKEFGAKLKATQLELEKVAKLRAESEKRASMFDDLKKRFKALIGAKKLALRTVHGRLVLKLRSKVLFAPNKAELRKAGHRTLKAIAGVLKLLTDRHFQVAGHTDNEKINPAKSKFKDNWELSSARAVEVLRFLAEQGVPAKNLSAAGFAEFQPVARNRSLRGRALNRRIEITLLPSIPSQLVRGK